MMLLMDGIKAEITVRMALWGGVPLRQQFSTPSHVVAASLHTLS